MRKFFRNNLLIIVISTAIALSLLVPDIGTFLKSLRLSDPIVFLIFLSQGMSLQPGQNLASTRFGITIAFGFFIAYMLYPLIAFVVLKTGLFMNHEVVGFSLMCCMTPTIVSGVVLAGRAKGDHTVALLLTVVLSLVGILTIPFNLRWMLQTFIEVDSAKLLRDLLFTVLLPSVVGWLLTKKLGKMEKIQRFMKNGQVYLLGFLLFVSLSAQSHRLFEINPLRLLLLAGVSLVLHLSILAVGYVGSKTLLRNTEASSRSLGIICSEKSLALGIPVWSVTFAVLYPLAILPPILFHFSQVFADGIIASTWAKRDVHSGYEQ